MWESKRCNVARPTTRKRPAQTWQRHETRDTPRDTKERRQHSRFSLKRNAGRLPDTVTGSTDEEIWRYRLLCASVCSRETSIPESSKTLLRQNVTKRCREKLHCSFTPMPFYPLNAYFTRERSSEYCRKNFALNKSKNKIPFHRVGNTSTHLPTAQCVKRATFQLIVRSSTLCIPICIEPSIPFEKLLNFSSRN